MSGIPSALAQARAISSRMGSPRTRHSLPHLRPMYSARTSSASLFIVKLCFLVKTRNATGRKWESSISTGRKVAGDCWRCWCLCGSCVCLFKMEEGTGWKGSELGGGMSLLSLLLLSSPSVLRRCRTRLKMGAAVDILFWQTRAVRRARVLSRLSIVREGDCAKAQSAQRRVQAAEIGIRGCSVAK